MAAPSLPHIFLFLCLPAILAKASVPDHISPPCPVVKCSQEIQTRLHLYLHQFPAQPGVPNRNVYGVIDSPEPIGFGQMYVHDWVLTQGLSATEHVVGRAQGFHLQAGQTTSSWYTAHTFVFRDGRVLWCGANLEIANTGDSKHGTKTR